MTRAILALALTLAFVPVAEGKRRAVQQHRTPPAIEAAAIQAAGAAMKAGAPAVQIAVTRRGQIIYSAAFGVTDQQSGTAATQRSVLQVGSLTKQFTSAAIMRLVERGALTLDDRIEKHVPEFNPRGTTITLRHLLTHTSGVAGAPQSQYVPLTREQSIALTNAQPLEFTPGSGWSYSNAGYRLLGHAIESVSGMSFAQFVHTEFALPLGLLDTGVCGTNNIPIPEGYGLTQTGWTRVPAVHMSVPFTAGALCSTASDLARWSHLLATGRVVLPESYAKMTTPAKLNNNTVTTYGLGLFLQKQIGRTTVWHTGGINGFQSSLVYFPEEELAVAVIINALPAPTGLGGISAHVTAIDVALAAFASPQQSAQTFQD